MIIERTGLPDGSPKRSTVPVSVPVQNPTFEHSSPSSAIGRQNGPAAENTEKTLKTLWRKLVGVEPTGNANAPPTGFEDVLHPFILQYLSAGVPVSVPVDAAQVATRALFGELRAARWEARLATDSRRPRSPARCPLCAGAGCQECSHTGQAEFCSADPWGGAHA